MEGYERFTFNGADSTFEEETKGSLEPGKMAVLIVLSDNILSIDPLTINELSVRL